MDAMDTMDQNQLAAWIEQQIAAATTPLVQQIQQLQQQEQFHQQAAQQQQPVNNHIKPAKPRTYSAERGSSPDEWIFYFEQYAELVNLHGADRVKLAATYLDGPAATWWRSIATQAAQGNYALPTWDEFKAQLIATFKPANAVQVARDRLFQLKQQGTVAKYNTEFTRLVLIAGNVQEPEKLDKYLRGLKPRVRVQVQLTNPTNTEDAMAKAQTVDSILWYNNPASNQPFQAPRVGGMGYAPMDLSAMDDQHDIDYDSEDNINAIQQNRRPTPRYAPAVSREEYQRCREKGLCLKCKKPGHIARFCMEATPQSNNQRGKGQAR